MYMDAAEIASDAMIAMTPNLIAALPVTEMSAATVGFRASQPPAGARGGAHSATKFEIVSFVSFSSEILPSDDQSSRCVATPIGAWTPHGLTNGVGSELGPVIGDDQLGFSAPGDDGVEFAPRPLQLLRPTPAKSE